jgi:hypothetical protein
LAGAAASIAAMSPANAEKLIRPPPFIVTGPRFHEHRRHERWRHEVRRPCRDWNCRWDR